MGADVDALEGAVVLVHAVMCTLRNGTVDTGILLISHLCILLSLVSQLVCAAKIKLTDLTQKFFLCEFYVKILQSIQICCMISTNYIGRMFTNGFSEKPDQRQSR